jgi:hypothetical protein
VKADRFAGYKVTPGREEVGADPMIEGKHGTILPYDGERLAVYVIGAQKLHRLMKEPGAVLYTEGEGEGTVHIPDRLLDVAAQIIEAKKTRTASAKQKDHLQQIGKRSRFKKTAA